MDCGASINYLKSAILNFLGLDLKTKEEYKIATKKLYVTYEKDNLAVVLLAELRF